jgi:hypothetical protein
MVSALSAVEQSQQLMTRRCSSRVIRAPCANWRLHMQVPAKRALMVRVVIWVVSVCVVGRGVVRVSYSERVAPVNGNNEGVFWVVLFVVESIEMGAS